MNTRKVIDGEDEDVDASKDKSTATDKEPSRSFNDLTGGQLPLTSIITQLRPTEVVRLLEYQVDWAEVVGLQLENQGLWIYALMSSLEKPPHPDVTRYCTTSNFNLGKITFDSK